VIINANDCYGNSGTSDAFAPGQKTETELGTGSWELGAGCWKRGAATKARVSWRKSGKKQDHNGSPRQNTLREIKFRNNRWNDSKEFPRMYATTNLNGEA